ncbi:MULTISPECIES: helix-turn-helix domain-containing protein [Kitasatospora]|uniref:helix-turn-helix domain-containing protein n=1 Tax=Kitasatospora TaxID=2063 RepID=UPI000C6FD585|nr:helix-turn-helix transcriptional regulator [Kitasatospora sp. GP30]MDH6141998.1 transcriptional regulator with XRE-family HTH domain [Kitasatospora sp. GP30]
MTITGQRNGVQSAEPGEEKRPEAPEDSEGAADFFRAIGKMIKLLRERKGLTQKEFGLLIGYGEDQVSSLERGRRTLHPDMLEIVDKVLDAGGLLLALKPDLEAAKSRARVRHPAWFRDYVRLESEAVEFHQYSSHFIPGLLQTEQHARALYDMRRPLLAEQTIEERVMARLARQAILAKWPFPDFSWILEEAVLRRPIGGWDVHHGQLEQLIRIGRQRNVSLQVMPMERTEHAGMGGPFTLLTPKGRAQVGYLEAQNISRLCTVTEEVRILASQYGLLRAQALTPSESTTLIQKMLGER